MAPFVFSVFVQWNIIAMQIREEWPPERLMSGRIRWAGTRGRVSHESDLMRTQEFYMLSPSCLASLPPSWDVALMRDVIRAIRAVGAALACARCMCACRGFRCGLSPSPRCTGGDHRRTQTGGAIRSSLKPSPGTGMWQCGGGGPWASL